MKTRILLIIALFIVQNLSAQMDTTVDWTITEDPAQEYTGLGNDIKTAGDVNGDGYSDVLVPARSFDENSVDDVGKVFLYYGSATGLSTTPAWSYTGSSAYELLGNSVSTAGDVNNDGYSDVIIGADEGKKAYLFLGGSSGLAASPDQTISGSSITGASINFGSSVSTAGDVNGDGYSDILIGDPYYGNDQSTEGSVFLYYGNSSGVSSNYDWYVESNISRTNLGKVLSTTGDINGDGYSDVVFGAPSYDTPQTNSGIVFAFYGSSTGLKTINNPTTDLITAIADFTDGGTGQTEGFGESVSSAGDVNGDGYADMIVGANNYYDASTTTNYGRAHIYYGSGSGLSTSSTTILTSGQTNDSFGRSVSLAGDVNGDGYSDVIIGASEFDNGNTDEGAAFIYLGGSTGITSTPVWTVEGNADYKEFGRSVFTAGDVNGDGYSDIVISRPDYSIDEGDYNAGAVYAYYGAANGLSTTANVTFTGTAATNFGSVVAGAGDLNGDGYSDLAIGIPGNDENETNAGKVIVKLGSQTGFNIEWSQTGTNSGSAYLGNTVSTAGDINGDGYSDLIVGEPWVTIDGANNIYGKVYIHYGDADAGGVWSPSSTLTIDGDLNDAAFGGVVASAGDVNGDGYSDVIIGNSEYGSFFRIYYGSDSGLDLGSAQTFLGSSISPGTASDNFGAYIASAGDVNGDGFSDIIVGDNIFANGNSSEGAAFVYLGSSSGLNSSPAWRIEGNADDVGMGYLVANGGDVNGDGYSDIIVGARTISTVYLFYGSSSGPSTSADWSKSNNTLRGSTSGATAGDLNGDGYGDIILGDHDNTTGYARIFLGSSSGLNTTASWETNQGNINSRYGGSVASLGDANGDGFSDIVIGDLYNSNFDGKVYVFYGAGATGKKATVQQYQNGTSTIIGPNGKVSSDGQIRLAQNAKSPYGKAKGKLIYEYAAAGSVFSSGDSVSNSVSSSGKQSAFTDLGLTGTELTEDISGIPTNKNYRWRSRVEYDKVTNPYQVYGPWRYYEAFQPLSSGSFKSQASPLPVELTYFTGVLENSEVTLNWGTATETNNYGFEIQKSEVSSQNSEENWVNIGFVTLSYSTLLLHL